MPWAAPSPCSRPGCAALTRERFCPAHRKAYRKESDQRRGSAAKRGYGPRWQRARKAFLQTNPLCAICLAEGKVEAAEVVDHKIPHRGDMALFWDKRNWQALSKACHDRKTAREDGAFGRPPLT